MKGSLTVFGLRRQKGCGATSAMTPTVCRFSMKRFAAVLMAALLLCAACACAEETAAAFVRAPLYDAPNAQANVLMRYCIGTRVQVVREVDAQYVQVTVGKAGGSLMGYMEKRDLEFGEKSIRAFRTEQVTCRGMEGQTSALYSYPDVNAEVIDPAFNLAAKRVLGYLDGGWLHVEDYDGSTGFIARDELEGEALHYAAAPYIATQPTEDELSREEALREAKARILAENPDVDAAHLERCIVEMDVLYYYEAPGQLTYSVQFRNPDTGYIDAGVSFLVEDRQIVKVSFGNG